MVGIEHLKTAAKLGIEFGQQIEQSAKDGFQVSDLFSFIGIVSQLPEVLKSKQALIDEFKDLDATERQELLDYIQEEFDLEDDRLEEIIEAALGAIVAILVLVDAVKK